MRFRNTVYYLGFCWKCAALGCARYAPLKSIKKWATARWQENVVVVRKFSDLENVKTVDHVIANICPKH